MCHVYFAQNILSDRLSGFSIMGSIYPDVIVSGILNRDVTHYNTKDLYRHFSFRDEQMTEFALGAVTHGVDMKGLDYYSDENYEGLNMGYCFIKGKEIEEDVVACCNIPEKWGLWKAHNFIEMAFDLYLCRNNPWIAKLLDETVNNTCITTYINKSLSEYYGIPASVISESFKKFTEFIQYDSTDAYSIIKKYALQLNRKHGINNVDIDGGAHVILKSVDIIKHEIEDFNLRTVSHIKQVVQNDTDFYS